MYKRRCQTALAENRHVFYAIRTENMRLRLYVFHFLFAFLFLLLNSYDKIAPKSNR